MNQKPTITLSKPYPYLDPGNYVARCVEASFDWSSQWRKNIAILKLEPLDYTGPRYAGALCKFYALGRNPEKPYAGPQSGFRRLLVEANGDQPPSLEADMDTFVGLFYDIEVVTVTKDRNGKPLLPVHHYSVVRSIHIHKGGL
jgi:hypothetical protein